MRPWPSRATRGVSWGACLRHQTRNSPAPLEWAMPVTPRRGWRGNAFREADGAIGVWGGCAPSDKGRAGSAAGEAGTGGAAEAVSRGAVFGAGMLGPVRKLARRHSAKSWKVRPKRAGPAGGPGQLGL